MFCKHKNIIIKRFKTTKSGQDIRLRVEQQYYECLDCFKHLPIPMYEIPKIIVPRSLKMLDILD